MLYEETPNSTKRLFLYRNELPKNDNDLSILLTLLDRLSIWGSSDSNNDEYISWEFKKAIDYEMIEIILNRSGCKLKRRKMKNLAQKVKETIVTGNYYFDVQYCHPERVKESALEHAENTAEEYFSKITDEEIEKSIEELGEETNVSRILTDIADRNCDHSGYETIACVVIAKNEE